MAFARSWIRQLSTLGSFRSPFSLNLELQQFLDSIEAPLWSPRSEPLARPMSQRARWRPVRSAGLLLASLVVLAALTGACTTAAPAQGTTEAVDQAVLNAIRSVGHLARGDALLDQGKLEEAIVEYREAIRLDPTHTHLWRRLGQVYAQLGRGEDALNSMERGLETDPGNAGTLNDMGWLYATVEPSALRDPAKALAYAQRAVEASGGTDANILDTLAEAYYANREFDKAIETEERALEIAPESEDLQNQLVKFREAKAAASAR
jgi:tetratricopeptide (TPR) repeat protein